jgi:2-methylisocitrate lyase-like PEP mutase family enzyme
MTTTIQDKRAAFKALHEQGCFIIPNPWDVGSALMLQGMGFKALASTSSGHAWSTGQADASVTRGHVLDHLRMLVNATDLPVNAQGVAESVRMAVATGVAGLSIEDATGDKAAPIYNMAEAVTRMRAARAAIDESGGDTLLVGRAENFLHGRADLADTIARLKAYADAGADCLYAPGIKTRDDIVAVVTAVAPKPVNLLIGWASDFTLADVAAMGVRRISVARAGAGAL